MKILQKNFIFKSIFFYDGNFLNKMNLLNCYKENAMKFYGQFVYLFRWLVEYFLKGESK